MSLFYHCSESSPAEAEIALKIFRDHKFLKCHQQWSTMSDTFCDAMEYGDKAGAIEYLRSQMGWSWCQYGDYSCTSQRHKHTCPHTDRWLFRLIETVCPEVVDSDEVKERYDVEHRPWHFFDVVRLRHKETGETIYTAFSCFEGLSEVHRYYPDDRDYREIVALFSQ